MRPHRRKLRGAALGATVSLLLTLVPLLVRADEPGAAVTLQTTTHGNVAWSYLATAETLNGETYSRPIPTHRPTSQCGYWGTWQLQKVNQASGERYYIVSIFDSCNNDDQVIPANGTFCANDGSSGASKRPSYCVDLPPRHIPVGLDPSNCMAGAEQYILLDAAVTPSTYDVSKGATLTATTSFADSMQQLLDERFCTDILSWSVVGWTFRWSDGTVSAAPGSGQDPATTTHAVAPQPGPSQDTIASVTAVAHLHIHGTALDFDPAGNIVTVTRDAFVDISNRAGAAGTGAAPVYTPPRLAAGGVAVGQAGDGTMPPLDPAAAAATHLTTLRGRLLDVYPRAVVISPGTESIGGVTVGSSTTTTTAWTYTGGWTDAPPGEGTPPGTSGAPDVPVALQWNHAERMTAAGTPVDEAVPLTITAVTTWPDGHRETETITAPVAVTIWYVGLDYNG